LRRGRARRPSCAIVAENRPIKAAHGHRMRADSFFAGRKALWCPLAAGSVTI